MRQRARRELAALHPVAAALGRRALTPDELRAIDTAQSLVLASVAAGTASRAECMDVLLLLDISVELGGMGIGNELLPEAEPLALAARQVLRHPHPAAAVGALLPRLLALLGPMRDQRGMATLGEWRRAQAVCSSRAQVAGRLRTCRNLT